MPQTNFSTFSNKNKGANQSDSEPQTNLIYLSIKIEVPTQISFDFH